ncbi:hypothetical protein LCGC14_1215810 [marine sediment metagenome]|uniref:Uncharacterized protein n=1 Tax=marine sediment metagenome TaxID=412755 RepID=A0A0F9NV07_9ZZZZ
MTDTAQRKSLAELISTIIYGGPFVWIFVMVMLPTFIRIYLYIRFRARS